ncbi:T9SS type A sorting domain-containing protein [Gilvibacter sp.]|uniref:T9SS type A sorting domain-containing protein n=1 Tax=Gilvibacter sp. TaxID=2729997 RepID=UPI0025C6276C|nr:T9SS type A sorting domain-containing protein [Gilvibacter sp.]NQX77814.1 T9SS type A sorting domain-containing protein [Gilvibacter sp.]
MDNLIWEQTSSIDMPINQWTEIEIDMKEGDSTNGYFKLKVDGVLHINKTDWTHHPADPLPDGFAHLQPLKLYTGKPQIDHFKANYGGNPTVYWDDFTIFNTSSLKVKYLKLLPSDCGVELNHSNNEITAPAIPGVGESWNNWSYVYRFQNVNDNTNVFYKGSYFNTISIDPFACDPLYDDSEYRIRVRVKNHPYFFDFGGSNDNYCLNSTNFVLCSTPGLTITPNPFSSGLLELHLSEVDSVKSIEIREITGGIVRLFGPNDFHSFQNKISLSNLELDKGLYLVRVDFGNKIETRKIVVR